MAKVALINKIKYNPLLYRLYRVIGNLALGVLKLFVSPDDRIILFVSFGGRKYDDSPRCIYERMMNDHRFDGYKLVWAFRNPNSHNIPGRGEKIKIDTFNYCIISLKARIWITNSDVTRGLTYKGRNTFYVNTWHGSAIKKLGSDTATNQFGFNASEDICLYDLFCAQSKFDIDVFSNAFKIPLDRFRITGLPRNDELISLISQKALIREKIGIPKNKKVILYAPTFREYTRDADNNCILQNPINIAEWERRLGADYVVLFRAHYEVIKYLNIDNNDFIIDVSNYDCLNELMVISDMLISDYSSIFFDYSILERPMICWAYDKEEYAHKRGMYFNIVSELKNDDIKSEVDLLNCICNMSEKERITVTQRFKNRYIQEYGDATSNIVDIIYKEILLP